MRAARSGAGVELTSDRMFSHRVKRLVGVSLVALGCITVLAVRSDGPTWAIVLLVAGWVLMPMILYASLSQPRLRLLLVVPATAVTIGLIGVVLATEGAESIGWLLITIGITFGGLLGVWFWYRWMPVPIGFDEPYGWPRILLIGVHLGLVLVGATIVLVAG